MDKYLTAQNTHFSQTLSKLYFRSLGRVGYATKPSLGADWVNIKIKIYNIGLCYTTDETVTMNTLFMLDLVNKKCSDPAPPSPAQMKRFDAMIATQ